MLSWIEMDWCDACHLDITVKSSKKNSRQQSAYFHKGGVYPSWAFSSCFFLQTRGEKGGLKGRQNMFGLPEIIIIIIKNI